ncbi:MBL fold metallo-hydrolase RNA specificity domain-containing protein [Geobacter grbiciae]|uniref:MBL fold metallo-hydrolase RNA specificity domain-containing protein n=1 Tax=Geobacter grbiciae TaxID=155042 RepID=UPI001C016A72|nr:MBL fold metallo-hydrolase [Geobacter grbiciae]MBT1075474.1 MBL fold metallo-hydrolase [Geobacter grbiciae]
MEIIHHGGQYGVTGSCHELVISENASILIDCGLLQGRDADAGKGKKHTPFIDFPLDRVQGLVLTHVHIDHCGRIPHLLGAGFQGPIWCSEASALLLPLVLEDAVKVGITRDEGLIERFIGAMKKRLAPLPYGTWHKVGTWDGMDVSLRLQQAGHILGSAYAELRVARPSVQETTASRRDNETVVVFSGDLGAPFTPLLPDPAPPERADILVLESTYGDRLHEGREQRREKLRQVIVRALENRGALLVPAFSIGRTQELLCEIESLIAEHRNDEAATNLPWDDLEIIVDSPLALRVTEVYDRLRHLWDQEATEVVSQGRHPLSFEQMTVIENHNDHRATVDYLRRTARPCVVIAAGGMCAGGRIVNYLKALMGDPRTDILFVGYQAHGTPGRGILEAAQTRTGTGEHTSIDLDGGSYPLRATVHSISGYSAHADQKDLVNFVRGIPVPPRSIRLVHGEEEARRALEKALARSVTEQ